MACLPRWLLIVSSSLVECSLEERLEACRRLAVESLESPRRFWLREAGLLVWARAEGDVVSWSFRELRQTSARMAQVLLSQGVRWGDRVVGHLPETPTLAMLHLGCARIGAVPVVVPARSGGALGRVLRATRARVLVTADEAPTPEGRLPLWD